MAVSDGTSVVGLLGAPTSCTDPYRQADGSRCCLILLDKVLVPVRPVPRRAFQGWRYLDATDAPPDLGRADKRTPELPPQMRRQLVELGLL